MARLFLAVDAGPVEKSLLPWMKKLKIAADRKDLSVRWVPAENRHITLVFLGEATPEQREKIESTVRPVTDANPGFSLRVEGLGAFPEPRSARVLWLGVQNSKKLRALRDRLAEPLRQLGFPIEEDYSPHLTIGRLRSPKSL